MKKYNVCVQLEKYYLIIYGQCKKKLSVRMLWHQSANFMQLNGQCVTNQDKVLKKPSINALVNSFVSIKLHDKTVHVKHEIQ